MKFLEDKIVWITGASSGIGKEMAIQMADKGAKIILTARNTEKLNQLKASLPGDGHIVYPMDLLKSEKIAPAVHEVISTVGHIDILVNNAGISQRALAKDTIIEVDRKIMELDYFSKIIMTKAILPHMTSRQSGMIISMSSVAGKIGTPMRTAYCAAKHALIGFMDGLRAEVHKDNIKVMIVAPGSVNTDVSINALSGDGSNHNIKDPAIANGLSVDVCVRKIIRGIQIENPELIIANTRERFAVNMRSFFPKILFKMMNKMAVT